MTVGFIRRILILACVAVIAAVGAAASDPVLVAWDSSNFKDALADEILGKLRESGVETTTMDSAKSIIGETLTDYSGIIVINTGMAGRMRNKVSQYILEADDLPPMVVVTTYGDPSNSRDPETIRDCVDCIASASLDSPSEIESICNRVLAGIGL